MTLLRNSIAYTKIMIHQNVVDSWINEFRLPLSLSLSLNL